MCPPCGVALLQAEDVPDLSERPEAEHPIGCEADRNETEYQHGDLRAWPQHYIRGDHARDRTRRSDQWNVRLRRGERMGRATRHPAQEIERQIAAASDGVFDVVAEHEQKQHV